MEQVRLGLCVCRGVRLMNLVRLNLSFARALCIKCWHLNSLMLSSPCLNKELLPFCSNSSTQENNSGIVGLYF